MPCRGRHGASNPLLDRFGVGAANTAAGYLAALIIFPVVFAGLGAWGAMYGADRPGQRPGGGGGGGGGVVPGIRSRHPRTAAAGSAMTTCPPSCAAVT